MAASSGPKWSRAAGIASYTGNHAGPTMVDQRPTIEVP